MDTSVNSIQTCYKDDEGVNVGILKGGYRHVGKEWMDFDCGDWIGNTVQTLPSLPSSLYLIPSSLSLFSLQPYTVYSLFPDFEVLKARRNISFGCARLASSCSGRWSISPLFGAANFPCYGTNSITNRE